MTSQFIPRPFCLALGALVFLAARATAGAQVDTGSLLREMTDLAILAEFPDPPYKTVLFSSYDRHSKRPYGPHWYANNDGFGKESIPNFLEVLSPPDSQGIGKYLLAEVNGPGAICRLWTARISGEIEMFLDGNPVPVFKGEANDFFLHFHSHYAREGGVISENIEEGFHQRQACYFPIPFSKSLKVVWTGNLEEIHFYQLEVRLYPAGTAVKSFSPQDLVDYREEIDCALRVLGSKGGAWRPNLKGADQEVSLSLEPGERQELVQYEGPSAIQEMTLKVVGGDPEKTLRQTILQAFFDGAAQPQIECPIGDFFGSGPGLSPFSTLPMRVSPEGEMTCRFLMPFAESAVFAVKNWSEGRVEVSGRFSRVDYDWHPDRSLHFFAKWRVDHGLDVGGDRGVYDLPYLTARGKGVFVGAAVQVLNPSSVPTSGGNWWGEGDEKIWFDGDQFPSLFGTGSEDYFNYAWSSPDLFDHAYFAQPLVTGPDNRGYNANIRWHILDPLVFEQRIDFYMELFHHTRTEGISYARTVYFYGTPGVRDDIRPVVLADVTQGLDLPSGWEPDAQGAASGANFFQAEDLQHQGENVEVEEGVLWSQGRGLVWRPKEEGEKLTLTFEVPEEGKYSLVGTFLYTPHSGRVGATLDEAKTLTKVADLYTPHQTMLRNVFFDDLELSAGSHTVTFESATRSEASQGSEIGIDFLWIRPRN